MSIANEITRHLHAHGASLVGFADIATIPSDARGGLPRAIAFAVALNPLVVRSVAGGATIEYFKECDRANILLGELSHSLAELLKKRGFRAIATAPTGEGVDKSTHATVLPHKTVATLAALGWIGKCALLVTPEYGSAIRLNRVLTDAPFETATPITQSRCGRCRACVDACPGGAPTGDNWDVSQHRDDFFDPFACRQAARKRAKERTGIVDTVCGICMAVCPHTKRADLLHG